VGKPHPHESAILHVTGEATYTDDIPELHGTLHAALGLSQKAHARVRAIDLEQVKAAPGVRAVHRRRHSGRERMVPSSTTIRSWPTAWCSTWASRSSSWWPTAMTRRAARAPGRDRL
jgi:hypothetical protein